MTRAGPIKAVSHRLHLGRMALGPGCSAGVALYVYAGCSWGQGPNGWISRLGGRVDAGGHHAASVVDLADRRPMALAKGDCPGLGDCRAGSELQRRDHTGNVQLNGIGTGHLTCAVWQQHG